MLQLFMHYRNCDKNLRWELIHLHLVTNALNLLVATSVQLPCSPEHLSAPPVWDSLGEQFWNTKPPGVTRIPCQTELIHGTCNLVFVSYLTAAGPVSFSCLLIPLTVLAVEVNNMLILVLLDVTYLEKVLFKIWKSSKRFWLFYNRRNLFQNLFWITSNCKSIGMQWKNKNTCSNFYKYLIANRPILLLLDQFFQNHATSQSTPRTQGLQARSRLSGDSSWPTLPVAWRPTWPLLPMWFWFQGSSLWR